MYEHCERFNQVLKLFEESFGFWDQNVLNDCCCSVVRDTDETYYKKEKKMPIFNCLPFI